MIPRFSPDYRLMDLVRCFLPAPRDAVAQLERAFAERSGHAEGIAFRYGRSGLYFLLKALGAKNKKVVMPAYTCVVVAHAVTLSGNTPVFLDNRPGGLQPDPQSYLEAIDADTVMVIPTHLFGIAEETEALCRQIRARHPGVFVLQDCAHSFFARDTAGVTVAQHGDGALYGMNISKLVNAVYGGMLTLRDSILASRIRNMLVSGVPSPAFSQRAYAFAAGAAFTPLGYEGVYWLTHHTSWLDSEIKYFDEGKVDLPEDFALPLSVFSAQIGLRSWARFESRVRARREIALFYFENLAGSEVVLPPYSTGHTWSHFPVLVEPPVRDSLRLRLEQATRCEIGIIVDYSVADLKIYRQQGHLTCPRASQAARSILNLPLTLQEGLAPVKNWRRTAERICAALRRAT